MLNGLTVKCCKKSDWVIKYYQKSLLLLRKRLMGYKLLDLYKFN